MTEEDLQALYRRLRNIHHAERRRAWLQGRMETLALGAACCAAALLIWREDNIVGVLLGGFSLLLAVAAFV